MNDAALTAQAASATEASISSFFIFVFLCYQHGTPCTTLNRFLQTFRCSECNGGCCRSTTIEEESFADGNRVGGGGGFALFAPAVDSSALDAIEVLYPICGSGVPKPYLVGRGKQRVCARWRFDRDEIRNRECGIFADVLELYGERDKLPICYPANS